LVMILGVASHYIAAVAAKTMHIPSHHMDADSRDFIAAIESNHNAS